MAMWDPYVASTNEYVPDVARMLDRRLDNILTYVKHRIIDASAEGFNTKIEVLILAWAASRSGCPSSGA